jgi:hypothetical protein
VEKESKEQIDKEVSEEVWGAVSVGARGEEREVWEVVSEEESESGRAAMRDKGCEV